MGNKVEGKQIVNSNVVHSCINSFAGSNRNDFG